jgi:tetratricopeptide (TPR) repeat protein
MRYWFLVIAGLAVVSMLACRAAPQERVLLSYARAAGAYASGDLEAAAVAARESLGPGRNFLPAAVLLGKINYFAGDDEAAIRSLKRAMHLSPRAGEAALWLARTFRAAGMASEARKSCELLLSTDPQNIAGLRLASCLAIDLHDIAAAVAYLDRAIESAGETGLAFADRAALRWAAGDAAGAQVDLEAALVTLPRDSAAWQSTEELLSRVTGAGQ